jgi:hypothetical protein
MKENRLSRVVFNNQSCRLCGAAHAARTRIRMACGGGSICDHGIPRTLCREGCGGGSICEHGKRRGDCKVCGKHSFCEHGKRRSDCKEGCGGGSMREHGKKRSNCPEEGCGKHLFCVLQGDALDLRYERIASDAPSASLGHRAFSRCRNATSSAVHESGDTPSLTTSRHLRSTPQMSLCRPVHRLPPNAAFFEAIFW